jgi:hypothetical protein
MSIYTPTQKNVALADATIVAVELPMGSKEHLFRVSPAVAWEFSFDQATMTAGDAMPMTAGDAYTIESPVTRSTIYIRQSSGSPAELKWAYLYPKVR